MIHNESESRILLTNDASTIRKQIMSDKMIVTCYAKRDNNARILIKVYSSVYGFKISRVISLSVDGSNTYRAKKKKEKYVRKTKVETNTTRLQ